MPLTPLADLASPPPEFIPCEIPNYLGSNWRNHVEFSGWGNRTYWLLLLGSKQGVYSLKWVCAFDLENIKLTAPRVTCIGAIDGEYKPAEVMEGFQRWEQVLPAWAKHCFHRHRRCATHAFACSHSACPEHARPAAATTEVPVKKDPGVGGSSAPAALRERTIKRDPGAGSGIKQGSPAPRIKQESSAPRWKAESPAPKAQLPPLSSVPREKKTACPVARRPPPPSYTPTPVPETDSDTEMPGGVPLYDPDSSDDNMDGGGALSTSALSSPTPGARGGEDSAKRVRRLEEIKQAYVPHQRKSQAARSTVFMPGVSAGSSILTPPGTSASASTAPVTSMAGGGREGKGCESTLGESVSTARPGASAVIGGAKEGKRREESASTALAGPSRLAAPSWDDPFYVVGGTIHHSSQKAFEDLVNGPVKVVMGWDAATRAAREAAGSRAGTSGSTTDL
ncbi:hypothetical protein B0H11DRAFT_1906492 [Mycena galericulata]|nr:hypothetical protein B0H11DRAFT_1906492 [Mycena galericulata]